LLGYPTIYLLLPLAAAFFLLGREFLMDIRDMAGDREAGIRTLPMLLDEHQTAVAAFFCLGIGAALTTVLALGAWSIQHFYLSAVVVLSMLLLTYFWFAGSPKYRRPIVLGLWVPMLCGILMLLR
jgi:4-hydroxybenzoate polyprenyltransferase